MGMHLPLHPTNQQPLPFINAERILIQIILKQILFDCISHLFKYIFYQYGFFLRVPEGWNADGQAGNGFLVAADRDCIAADVQGGFFFLMGEFAGVDFIPLFF